VSEDKFGNKNFGKIEPKLRKNDGFMAFDVVSLLSVWISMSDFAIALAIIIIAFSMASFERFSFSMSTAIKQLLTEQEALIIPLNGKYYRATSWSHTNEVMLMNHFIRLKCAENCKIFTSAA